MNAPVAPVAPVGREHTPRVVVQLRGVTVGYADRAVVHDVDLTVHDGEVVAVLGANGSGKTTLVRGLLGLATVLRGDIELHGRPVRTRQDRARIGYVPQRHTVGGGVPCTVREVVASGRLARLGLFGRPRAADRAAVEAAVEAVQLTAVTGTDVAQLSGGQQRRVLIARALAADPDILVMDEPTAGVDRDSQQALAATIRALAGRGVPMIIVTHDVGPLADVLSRAVVVSEGRISYDGPTPAAARGSGDDQHHVPDRSDLLADRPTPAALGLDHPLAGA